MRCKPGDLAVIVNGREFPRNNGAFVRIVGRASEDAYGPDCCDWDCEPLQPLMAYDDENETSASVGMAKVCFDDDQLRPIRPGAEPESTTTPRELEAA